MATTETYPQPKDRRYHSVKGAQYTLPNDDPEHVRLETQAVHLSALMSDKIIHSTLRSQPSKILDVGCGTGVVTTALATRYPTARVFGLDLTPVPNILGRQVPSNIEFVQGDILNLDNGQTPKDSGLALASPERTGMEAIRNGHFDLIYSRLLLCGLSDWPGYLRTAASLLAPNGWVEVHDMDWIWYDESSNAISDKWEWLKVLRKSAEDRGLDFECGSRAAGWMRDAGLVDIRVEEYYWPFGGEWEEREEMKQFGEYVATEMPRMFMHVILKVNERHGYTEEQVGRWQEQMREDFRPEKGKHWKFYVTCGRRSA